MYPAKTAITRRSNLNIVLFLSVYYKLSTFACRMAGRPQGIAPTLLCDGRATTRDNTSHLRTSHGKFQGERIKQVDKIEKLILRIKGRRWRHLALLRFVLVVDLLDLPTIDAQATNWQNVLCHLVPQALEQGLSGLLGLHGESQRDRLGQFKESLAKPEAIRIQFCLHRGLRQQGAHGIMGQGDAVEAPFVPLQASWSAAPCAGLARAF